MDLNDDAGRNARQQFKEEYSCVGICERAVRTIEKQDVTGLQLIE
jgi:hypothetical protein